jgi:hypothetical protein
MLRLLAAIILLDPAFATAQDAAPFAGTWRLNRELSEDLAGRVKEAAGSAHMAGGPKWAEETWLPWGADFSEPERLGVRELLLKAVPAFDAVEIRQDEGEIKTTHGEAGSRIFRFKRKSAGTSALGGETVKREARLEGGQLVLESRGKHSLFREVFMLDPSTQRLVYTIFLEQERLKAPLQARLVYDRAS